jgi:hypothetical protein
MQISAHSQGELVALVSDAPIVYCTLDEAATLVGEIETAMEIAQAKSSKTFSIRQTCEIGSVSNCIPPTDSRCPLHLAKSIAESLGSDW